MMLADYIRRARRVYLIGNGGSYANAVHIANDLISCGVKAFAPDPATLTALANDNGFESTFALWLQVVGEAGDLVIALSGSGRSPNIVQALKTAKALGMATVALTGAYEIDPPVAELADACIRQGLSMQDAEDWQLTEGHNAMRALR